jgi:hypothetical protein
VVSQPIFIVMLFVPTQYGTLLFRHLVMLNLFQHLFSAFLASLRENKKAKSHALTQTKNHANKNGLKLLKHNVVLCVRFAQPCHAHLHAG